MLLVDHHGSAVGPCIGTALPGSVFKVAQISALTWVLQAQQLSCSMQAFSAQRSTCFGLC